MRHIFKRVQLESATRLALVATVLLFAATFITTVTSAHGTEAMDQIARVTVDRQDYQSLDSVLDESDVVLVGEVIDGGMVVGGGMDKLDTEETVVPTTRYRLKVLDSIMGIVKANQVVEIEVLGGSVEGVDFVVENAPSLEKGQEYLVFGSKLEASLYRVGGGYAAIAKRVGANTFSLPSDLGELTREKSQYTVADVENRVDILNTTK